MENIIKKISDKTKELYNDIKTSSIISISAIVNNYLKEPFDSDTQAEKQVKKCFNVPGTKYYQMTKEQILEQWENASKESCNIGSTVDDYFKMIYECKDDSNSFNKKRALFKVNYEDNEKISKKLKGADIIFDQLKKSGLDFITREKTLLIPFKYKNIQFYIKGRFDALFGNDKKLILIDWKTTEKINDKSFFGSKLLGPCSKLDDCELNLYTLQVYMYIYALKHIYNIEMPLSACIIQFPFKPDYFYRIFKPNFEYDEKLIEEILKFSIKKYLIEKGET